MHLKQLVLLLPLVLILGRAAQAQPGFVRADTVKVTVSGDTLKNPWAGGLNFCQFSQIDLNQDGIKDLFVFDRSGNRISTFINHGTPNTVDYTYAPQYIGNFPPLHDWALLQDYNCDGKEDIFSYSDVAGGIKVYKNISTTSTGLQFQLVTPLIYSTYYNPPANNLYVSQVDIPALVDMDDDGDLDILTFWVLGTYVEYHKNLSMETYGTCDSLKFQMKNQCWGYFSENASNNSVNINDSCGSNVPNPQRKAFTNELTKERHTGSTLLSFDTNCDGTKELLLGDVSFSNMVMLYNDGTPVANHIGLQDYNYPSYDTPINVTLFPAAFYLDVNNDGEKDLIVSPNAQNVSENFTSVHYYKDVAAGCQATFSFVKNDLLQDEMIETGEGAYPAWFDYDNDGLKDLFIGNYAYYAPGPDQSMVSLYRNTGTAASPKFDLVTRDYANLNSLGLLAMAPSFGDLDNDGDKDMIIGDYNGHVHYFENIAPSGNTANFVLSQANMTSVTTGHAIDVGSFATPQIIDVDRDGKNDLLIGARSGKLAWYRNTSATSPVFDSITHFFGGVNVTKVNSSTGYSVPMLYDRNGTYNMLVGTESGYLYRYTNIENNLNGTFTKADTTYKNLREGLRTAPAITYLNNDTLPDLVIGNYAGGVSLFMGDIVSGIYDDRKELAFAQLYPNPAADNINIAISSPNAYNAQVIIYSVLGQELKRTTIITNSSSSVDIAGLPAGVYYCRIIVHNSELVKKFIVQH
jgi:hypothetical protein